MHRYLNFRILVSTTNKILVNLKKRYRQSPLPALVSTRLIIILVIRSVKRNSRLKLKDILEAGLEKPQPVKVLVSLKHFYPALSNGRLGQLFDLSYKKAGVKVIINSSREPLMLL